MHEAFPKDNSMAKGTVHASSTLDQVMRAICSKTLGKDFRNAAGHPESSNLDENAASPYHNGIATAAVFATSTLDTGWRCGIPYIWARLQPNEDGKSILEILPEMQYLRSMHA